VQEFLKTGQAPYPPARTLLTTGVIDAVMNSRYEGHRRVDTPGLDVTYTSYSRMPIRPRGTRPSGVCVDPATPDVAGKKAGE
jgi:hypothetical protein